MTLEQPKKLNNGAYGAFLAEKRLTKACEGQSASAISSMAGEAWKKLSEADKQPYQQKYEIANDKYEKDIAVFFAAGGEKAKGAAVLRKEKRNGKDEKKSKDKDSPMKPVGGAYGIFVNEKRDEFKKQLEAIGDKSFVGVAKLASAAWKALSDEEKKPYEEKYKVVHEKYTAEMAEYKASKPEGETISMEESPKNMAATHEKTSPPKRAASSEGKTGPATKRKVAKSDETPSVILDAALLKES